MKRNLLYREFVIERIHKGFIRQKPEVSVRNIEMFVLLGGLLYRDSTAVLFFSRQGISEIFGSFYNQILL